MKHIVAELERAAKARELRYKKSIAQGFNIEEIKQELLDLQDEMDKKGCSEYGFNNVF